LYRYRIAIIWVNEKKVYKIYTVYIYYFVSINICIPMITLCRIFYGYKSYKNKSSNNNPRNIIYVSNIATGYSKQKYVIFTLYFNILLQMYKYAVL